MRRDALVVVRKVLVQLLSEDDSRFVRPCPRDVLLGRKGSKKSVSSLRLGRESQRGWQTNFRRVPSSSYHNHRDVKLADEFDAVGVSLHRQVEDPQLVTCQRVGSALEDNGSRTVPVHDVLDDGLEDAGVRLIGDSVSQRDVDGVVLPSLDTDVLWAKKRSQESS
jgi:hypothetical protein